MIEITAHIAKRRNTRNGCIRIGGADEFWVMPHTSEAEIVGYSSAAARGDVLPICLRLANMRTEAEWEGRAELVSSVGPACRPDLLARACDLMPNAAEPRLLRAARALALADVSGSYSIKRACFESARKDLAEAARIDPMDATVRAMLSELVGSQAWAAQLAA